MTSISVSEGRRLCASHSATNSRREVGTRCIIGCSGSRYHHRSHLRHLYSWPRLSGLTHSSEDAICRRLASNVDELAPGSGGQCIPRIPVASHAGHMPRSSSGYTLAPPNTMAAILPSQMHASAILRAERAVTTLI
jgi:hypothetical protein